MQIWTTKGDKEYYITYSADDKKESTPPLCDEIITGYVLWLFSVWGTVFLHQNHTP
jgi:hypothetical protein